MRNVVMISENGLAGQMRQEAMEYTLKQDRVYASDMGSLSTVLSGLEDRETVILADAWNSEVCRQAMEWIQNSELHGKTICIGGMNLAMAIAAISYKDDVDTLEELAKTLIAQSQAALMEMKL